MPGVVIAGTHSGCGKTTITLAVLAALKKKGMAVQSFKAGPDFIDTGLHRMITGRPSRNLDLWMCGEEYVKVCFHKHSTGVDISVVEGVMGLYDGDQSTAKLADALNLPVILVVDAYGMAESAGATVKGFMEYKNPNLIKGIIFNRVASERHFKRLKNSVRGVEVLGYLPRDLSFEIPHRHLGLTVAEENPIARENIERLVATALKYIDIEAIYRAAEQQTSSLNNFERFNNPKQETMTTDSDCQLTTQLQHCSTVVQRFKNYCSAAPLLYCSESGLSPTSAKIAIAYDKAFCFYYEDNLDLLKKAGAEIATFSPLSDSNIPEADAVYIGGGYPELYAGELSKNQSMLKSIYNWADSGKPMYAECGGLMYLSRGIYDCDGNFFKMAGVFPFETRMKKGRSHLGYREIQLNDDCIIGKKGDRLRGHEFHYSEISNRSQIKKNYSIKDNNGHDVLDEGYRFKNTIASYVHIHFGSNPAIAGNFIDFIKSTGAGGRTAFIHI